MKSLTRGMIAVRAAAMLVATLGCFAGCAESLPVTEAVAPEMIALDTWFFTSGVPNNKISVKAEKNDVVFYLTTDYGYFWDIANQNYADSVTLQSGGSTYWHSRQKDAEDEEGYIDVIARKGTSIAGYAVIKIVRTDSLNYSATVLKSAWILGGKDSITEEKLSDLIDATKNE